MSGEQKATRHLLKLVAEPIQEVCCLKAASGCLCNQDACAKHDRLCLVFRALCKCCSSA